MGIELEGVDVQVDIDWDFRGTMATDRDVPVGATGIRMTTRVKLKEGLDEERVDVRDRASGEPSAEAVTSRRHELRVETLDF